MSLVEIPCTLLFVSRARLSLQFHPQRLIGYLYLVGGCAKTCR
jgi:hypothetical protein